MHLVDHARATSRRLIGAALRRALAARRSRPDTALSGAVSTGSGGARFAAKPLRRAIGLVPAVGTRLAAMIDLAGRRVFPPARRSGARTRSRHRPRRGRGRPARGLRTTGVAALNQYGGGTGCCGAARRAREPSGTKGEGAAAERFVHHLGQRSGLRSTFAQREHRRLDGGGNRGQGFQRHHRVRQRHYGQGLRLHV